MENLSPPQNDDLVVHISSSFPGKHLDITSNHIGLGPMSCVVFCSEGYGRAKMGCKDLVFTKTVNIIVVIIVRDFNWIPSLEFLLVKA